jgi:FtsP/CotA-like multicopper oxidase with cupredoxin domain
VAHITTGIEQINTPWADGAPGLTQRNIQPGKSFTYKWHANQYGSYFYHAHTTAQIDDGAYGPMVIKPQKGLAKPFDRVAPADVALLEKAEAEATPIMLSDWRHSTAKQTLDYQTASGIESALCVDSILVNGKGAVDCWSQEDLTKYRPNSFKPLQDHPEMQMTAKGCLPAELLASLSTSPANVASLPAEVFNTCTSTQGSHEVIKAADGAKWIALDFIQSASVGTYAVSIDEHPMWVYAVDGHYIEPQKVDALNAANGDRYSVFVQLDKPGKIYALRVANIAASQLIDTKAVLSYGGGVGHYKRDDHNDRPDQNDHNDDNENIDFKSIKSTPSILRNGTGVSPAVVFFSQPKMVSFPPSFPQPAPAVDQTFKLNLQNVGNTYTWALNNIPYDHQIDNSDPPLLYRQPSEVGTPNDITIKTKNNTWVDLIFTVGIIPQSPHPIHKHSNKVYIIGSGTGPFNWTNVAEAQAASPQSFNLVNPPYRDGFSTPPASNNPTWLAVRYHVANPGAWMLHCHNVNHLVGGMAMVLLDGVDEWPEVPDDCKN